MDIDVGDVVVCVDASAPKSGKKERLMLGRHYRVIEVILNPSGDFGLDVAGTSPLNLHGRHAGWRANRFRRIGNPDPQWVERIVREHQPVSPLVTV